ncbi:PAS-domain containing protein [Yoonia sp. 208BN28-4]|uniref:PAS-domain containing protein n=1 Tax=Yoonia sp. 208BN28-4 TaxID=3126505 RepID=UPI003099A0E1
MSSLSMLDLGVITAFATLGAGCLALLILGIGPALISGQRPAEQAPNTAGPTFLFDDQNIIDASTDARGLIAGAPSHLTGQQKVERLFRHRFPSLGQEMDALLPNRTTRLAEVAGTGGWIELCKTAGRTRLTLLAADGDLNDITQTAMVSELEFLRNIAETAPQQIWQQNDKGHVIWANRSYLALSDRVLQTGHPEQAAWPDKPIFDGLEFDIPDDQPRVRRRSVQMPGDAEETWFDITSLCLDDTSLHFASDANSAVMVEQAHKTMLQTFGKTFASLSTGLAIFDSKRQLSIFNPALMDLTGISFDFLSGKPTIEALLDRLRDDGMLPEPKNYTSWKDQFRAVEDAAMQGVYCENWVLAGGLTYRVTGKPQGDGAFAFFFEDISAEVSLTRRFRSEIETGQAVLDTLPDAIAVFSSGGGFVMSNSAYDDLWDIDSFGLLGRQDIRAETATWQKRCSASPIWADLRAFISGTGERIEWSDTAILDDGRRLTCTARPIAGGKTLVSFQLPKKSAPRIEMLTRPDRSLRAGKR